MSIIVTCQHLCYSLYLIINWGFYVREKNSDPFYYHLEQRIIRLEGAIDETNSRLNILAISVVSISWILLGLHVFGWV